MKSNLPPNWSWVKLGDICTKLTDGSHYSPKSVSTGLPYITVKDVNNDRIDFDGCKRINRNDFNKLVENDCKPIKNDVLFSKDGTVGKVSIIDFEKEFVVLSSLAILRPNIKSVFPKYLFHFLKSSTFLNQALSKKKGVAIRRIILRDLKELKITLPPLPEQKKIVQKIEELFSGLDSGVVSIKKAKEQIKLYRQSVLVSAFIGKLIGNGNIDQKTGLPKGLKWVKNKDLLKYVTSGSRDWKKYYSGSGARFIRTQDINTNRLILENAAYVMLPEKVEGKRSLVEKGDLLMTITGANVGKVAFIDFPIEEAYVSQSVALLKYIDKKITKYLWYYFQAPEFGKSFIDKLVYGMGRPVLSLANMRDVDVLICPEEQQKLIISEIEKRYSEADNLEKAIDESLEKSEALRQSILKQAFEGKLV